MGGNKAHIKLVRFFDYVLGHNPAEFGLVPDNHGFFKIKEFLKAVCEEEGFRHVRRSHLDEILLTVSDVPIEIRGQLIRARNRENLSPIIPAIDLPKLLYSGIRRKAHKNVMEKGIHPMGYPQVILCSRRVMAERIAKRIDQKPVILTVSVASSINLGVKFFNAGEGLFLSDTVPVGCFSGPPVPKQLLEEKKSSLLSDQAEKNPGTYPVRVSEKISPKNKKYRKGKKDISWKKERKLKQKISEKW